MVGSVHRERLELGNLPALLVLSLSENQLSGSIPVQLGGLPALIFLHLRNNQLSGPIPAELGNLPALGMIDLSFNQLSGLVPLPVASLGGELQQIALDRCRFESNPDLFMPGSQDYIDADLDNDGFICGIGLSTPSPEEILAGIEAMIETLVELGSLNDGQGISLTSKLRRIQDFIEEGKTKQAMSLWGAFINHLDALVASGVLSEE